MILSPHQHALGICQHTPLADVVEAHRALFGDAGTQPSLDYIATHPDATLSEGGPHLQHLAPEFIAILFDAIYNHHEDCDNLDGVTIFTEHDTPINGDDKGIIMAAAGDTVVRKKRLLFLVAWHAEEAFVYDRLVCRPGRYAITQVSTAAELAAAWHISQPEAAAIKRESLRASNVAANNAVAAVISNSGHAAELVAIYNAITAGTMRFDAAIDTINAIEGEDNAAAIIETFEWTAEVVIEHNAMMAMEG